MQNFCIFAQGFGSSMANSYVSVIDVGGWVEINIMNKLGKNMTLFLNEWGFLVIWTR